MITIVFWVLDEILYYYMVAVIIAAVLSTLVSFGVLDTRNRMVWTITDFFYRFTEPALKPIRRRMPDLGGIDISPLILILLLQVARMVLARVDYAVHSGSLSPLLL
jgi:YggT family protein